MANRSADICNGHGIMTAHSICRCDEGYGTSAPKHRTLSFLIHLLCACIIGDVACRGDFSTPWLYQQLWICLGINIAFNTVILAMTIWRTIRVLIIKCAINRNRTFPIESNHHHATCHWMDSQMACLLTLIVSSSCNLVSASVGRIDYLIVSQQVWYGGVVLQEVAAVFFVRFFASIVAKYHRPTYQLIRILDYTTLIWMLLALTLVIAMPFTDISDEGPVTNTLVALIGLFLVFIVVSSQIYSLTILNSAIKGSSAIRRTIHVTESSAALPPTPPHAHVVANVSLPLTASSVTALVTPVPPRHLHFNNPAQRATLYTSNSAMLPTTVAFTSPPSPSPTTPLSNTTMSAADIRRITTLTNVKHSVRGMQIVGIIALISVGLSATIFVGTDSTSMYLNNNIGWWCPMVSTLLMVWAMGRSGRSSPTPSLATHHITAPGAGGGMAGGTGIVAVGVAHVIMESQLISPNGVASVGHSSGHRQQQQQQQQQPPSWPEVHTVPATDTTATNH
jgi:hypothetical protein